MSAATNLRSRRAILAGAGLAILLAAAAAEAGPADAAEATIHIANFTFSAATLTVSVGTTVTWVNDDDIPHLVVEKDGSFRSQALDTNDTYSWQAAKAGTVEYYCALHPHMTGTIVVTP